MPAAREWIRRNTLGRSTALSRWYYGRRAAAEFAGGRDVLAILTPGHVGSTSAARSLEGWMPERVFLNLHSVNRDLSRERGPIPPRMVRECWVGERLEGLLRDRDWDVVNVVRDPVAANVGGLFHVLESWHGGALARFRAAGAGPGELLEFYLREGRHHEYLARWHDGELRDRFGVDVLGGIRDPSRGWWTVGNGRVRVLVVKLERIGECWEEAIRSHFGRAAPPLLRVNEAGSKPYADLYEAFDGAILPPDHLDRLLGTRYATTFYSEEERAAFRRKWSRPR